MIDIEENEKEDEAVIGMRDDEEEAIKSALGASEVDVRLLAIPNDDDDEQEVYIGDFLPNRRRETHKTISQDRSVFIDEIKVMPPSFNQLTEFINAKHCRKPYREGDALDKVRRYPICGTKMGIFSCLK